MATGKRFNCATGQQEEYEYTPAAPSVPERISRHQFRRALTAVNAGKRTAFEAWLANGSSQSDKDYFRDARWISRAAVAVENARVAVSVSNNALNNMFISALDYDE